MKNDDVFLQFLTVIRSVNLKIESMDFLLQFSAVTDNLPFLTIFMRVTLYQVSFLAQIRPTRRKRARSPHIHFFHIQENCSVAIIMKKREKLSCK